jgi:hypothetical protein
MRLKSIWLVIVVISCFLIIHQNYNSSPYTSLFTVFRHFLSGGGLIFNLKPDNYILHFVVITLYLVFTALLEKKLLVLIGLFCLVGLLMFWIYTLHGVIDFKLYTIVPFALSSAFSIIYLGKRIKTKHLAAASVNAGEPSKNH